MIYGYARCSTNESKQDITRQTRELKTAGAKKVFLEYERGDSVIKEQLDTFFEIAKDGDTLLTLEVSRLTRSTKQLCELLEKIKEKKLRLIILGSITVDCRSGNIDPMSNAFLQMSVVFAELERFITVARVKSGLEHARAKGVKLGRPRMTKDDLPQKFLKYYPTFKAKRMTKTDFARVCNVSRTTLYAYLRLAESQ